MLSQTVLPFKLEITRDRVTPHGGLAVFGEFMHAMGVPSLIDRELPGPGSGAGYQPSAFVEPLLLMLHGGGRSLEDLRQIRMDTGLRDLLKMDKIPSSDAVGDWLRRSSVTTADFLEVSGTTSQGASSRVQAVRPAGSSGLSGLARVHRQILRRALNREERTCYTLDIDATQIIAEKKEARKTYKGEIGYMPIVGHLAENGLVIADEFREGNASPGSRNLEFAKHCAQQMPKGKRIAHFRADSASYQAKIFNWCQEHDITFAIGADLDTSVQAAIAQIQQCSWRPFRDGHIAETVHSMNRTENAFRLIVLRRPVQRKLFEEDTPCERYTVIASNRGESAQEIVKWYNRRGETSENRLKELKIGFGMERMPCGDFGANAVFFRVGVLAYNLFVLFKILALPESWRTCQVQTLRWRLYQTAGKVVSHAGSVWLKVRRFFFSLMEEVRTRCRELAWA